MGWCGLLLTAMLAATSGDAAGDPWKGRDKDEIIALLGDPPKRKRLADGVEVWTYRLVRIADDAVVPPGMALFPLPGYGLLGRMLDPEGETVEMLPSEFDEEGRVVSGGVTTSQHREIHWSKKEGRVEHESPPARPTVRGKVKLTFEIDASGRIRAWTASPPPPHVSSP